MKSTFAGRTVLCFLGSRGSGVVDTREIDLTASWTACDLTPIEHRGACLDAIARFVGRTTDTACLHLLWHTYGLLKSGGVRSVFAEDSVGPQHACTAGAGTSQGASLEGVNSLVVAHLDVKVATEIGLGDMELDAVDIGAPILSKGIDVQLDLLRVLVGQVLHDTGLDGTEIVDDDLGAILHITIKESDLLGVGSICELASSAGGGVLGQGLAERAVAVVNIDGLDLIASSASCLISGGSLVSGDGQVVRIHNSRLLGLELTADLGRQKTSRNQTVVTGNGNGLVALEGIQQTTLLTGDVGRLLGVGDRCILKLIQDPLELTRDDVKRGDGLQAGDSKITHIDSHIVSSSCW